MRLFYAVLFTLLLLPCLGAAQEESQAAAPTSDQLAPTGPKVFLQLQGSSTPLGAVTSGTLDVGYDLTSHLGGDIGLPFFFVRSPFSLVTKHDWKYWTLWGNPYVDVHYTTTRLGLDITTVLTGTIPLTDTLRTFTTGRFGVDWFNHVERGYGRFTPFLNFGVANGTGDRFFMPRPYSMDRPYETLGVISDFEGGVSYKFLKDYRIGVSAYALVPAGPQKVYSRLVSPDSLLAGDGQHYRYWDANFETTNPTQVPGVAALVGSGTFDGCSLVSNVVTCKGGLSSIARDNGYSAWLEITRVRNVTIQFGYTRSIHYRYDSATVMLNFNGTPFVRGLMK